MTRDIISSSDELDLSELDENFALGKTFEESLDIFLFNHGIESPTNATNPNSPLNKDGSLTIERNMQNGETSPSTYAAMNAFHMEIQENAKIPNLYGIPIRRVPEGSADEVHDVLDEIVRLSEEDLSLTEKFLGSDHRLSAARAYSNAGSLMSNIGSRIGEKVEGKKKEARGGANNDETNDDSQKNKIDYKERNDKSPNPLSHEKESLNNKIKLQVQNVSSAITTDPISSVGNSNSTTHCSALSPLSHEKKSLNNKIKLEVQNLSSAITTDPISSICNSNSTTHCSTLSGSEVILTQPHTATPLAKNHCKESLYRIYPYGRPIPLPIPTKAPTSPQLNSTTHNSSQINNYIKISNDFHSPSVQIKQSQSKINDNTYPSSQQKVSAQHTIAGAPPTRLRKNNMETPLELTAKTSNSAEIIGAYAAPFQSNQPSSNANYKWKMQTPYTSPSNAQKEPPSLQEATKKRSQFGFGGNHSVPSVPPPPTKMPLMSIKTVSKKRKFPSDSSSQTGSTYTAVNTSTTLAGPSYERKKQKAKDARVRLNESIEKLSVAINVAGTQSQQRLIQFMEKFSLNSSKASFEGKSRNNLSTLQEHSQPLSSYGFEAKRNVQIRDATFIRRSKAAKTMEEVVNSAESAKKWDRPSFVGTAATMVHGLNAQCETLMIEAIQLKSEMLKMRKWIDTFRKLPTSNKSIVSINSKKQQEIQGEKYCRNCENIVDTMASPSIISGSDIDELEDFELRKAKVKGNVRLSQQMKTSPHVPNPVSLFVALDISSIINCVVAMKSITSFLDPLSLSRCMRVSRCWNKFEGFSDNHTWIDICINRFGPSNVWQWQELYKMREDRKESQLVNSAYKIGSSGDAMHMYQSMDASLVKPKSSFEGNIQLGQASIKNTIAAWVSCVERSNGETMRCVRHDSTSMKYISLPVVEVRILLQNIGVSDGGGIFIPEQILSIDASTRRRGEEFYEVTTDNRLLKKVLGCQGRSNIGLNKRNHNCGVGDLLNLSLFESAIISFFAHAKSCTTSSKFRQRSNFLKILIRVHGRTQPLVIQFGRE